MDTSRIYCCRLCKCITIYLGRRIAHQIQVTLCLDIRHRPRDDIERVELRGLVEEAICLLQLSSKSAIARRGTRLLSKLLTEESQQPTHLGPISRKRGPDEITPNSKRHKSFDVTSFVRRLRQGDPTVEDISPRPQSTSWEAIDPDPVQQSLLVPAEHSLFVPPAEKHVEVRHSPYGTITFANGSTTGSSGQSFMGTAETFDGLLFLGSSYDFT